MSKRIIIICDKSIAEFEKQVNTLISRGCEYHGAVFFANEQYHQAIAIGGLNVLRDYGSHPLNGRDVFITPSKGATIEVMCSELVYTITDVEKINDRYRIKADADNAFVVTDVDCWGNSRNPRYSLYSYKKAPRSDWPTHHPFNDILS